MIWRRGIKTTVLFLTMRVKKPDEDDWIQLMRYLKYLKVIKHMNPTRTVDSLSIVKWRVDASYDIHDDHKGHTGAMITLGEGAVISMSNKQQLNVKISTEVKLVGSYDALGQVI